MVRTEIEEFQRHRTWKGKGWDATWISNSGEEMEMRRSCIGRGAAMLVLDRSGTIWGGVVDGESGRCVAEH